MTHCSDKLERWEGTPLRWRNSAWGGTIATGGEGSDWSEWEGLERCGGPTPREGIGGREGGATNSSAGKGPEQVGGATARAGSASTGG